MDPDPRVGVVVISRDRRASLLATLPRLLDLPEAPAVVVVDNGSSDGTVDAVRASVPAVEVVEAGENLGAGGRTVGVRRLQRPYVAFADDDSWWAPGALRRAADVLDACPALGLVAARVLVGPDERLDPVAEAMAASPLPAPDGVPGRGIIGFVACGAVVRRDAFLAVGGFDARYGVGGEEHRLALDLAAAGWALAYVPEVVAHHHPAQATQGRPRRGRRSVQVRNELWSAWLRRPLIPALRRTVSILAAEAPRRPHIAAHGLARALAGTPWVVPERRPVPTAVERAVREVQALDG